MLLDQRGSAARTVLVAEDQALVGLELAGTLQNGGYVALGPVASNVDGLALLRRVRPDAALIDTTLADGQAVPLVEALLAAGVPVGLATGHQADELEPPLRGLPLLNKPYGPLEAIGFVRRLLGAEKDAA